MSKEFGYTLWRKEEGGEKKNTAPTQREFLSAPGEGKVDIYLRR